MLDVSYHSPGMAGVPLFDSKRRHGAGAPQASSAQPGDDEDEVQYGLSLWKQSLECGRTRSSPMEARWDAGLRRAIVTRNKGGYLRTYGRWVLAAACSYCVMCT